MVRFDGVKMFEDLSLVFGLRITAHEHLQSNVLMLAGYVSYEISANRGTLTQDPYTARP